ncbi:hypothetical protein [Streptomyces sp. NPDC006134]|uniref:hypothetical protein n=1 Tax=Streptomyces sp. NPDC006134 TaxID=3154467 RepID=UPI0033DF1F52
MTTPTQYTAEQLRAAAESAGRAAGYCWLPHPESGLHCTRPPHQTGPHEHTYRHIEWH